MFTIQDYIDSLNRDKETLVANLTTKGVTCSDSETFTTLVPKVLDITFNLQSKSETITTNTTTTITPDTGYDGLSSVSVTTNVQSELSEYFTSSVGLGTNNYPGVAKMIKTIPNNTTISGNSLLSGFCYCSNLETIPLLDTSSVETMNACFYQCSSLVSIPAFNTSNCTDFQLTFGDCTNLENVPILNTSSATNLYRMFRNCLKLTDTSLDNILQMCINATIYTGTKTLVYLGISDTTAYPTSRIQALPHYQDFIDAGWTIGY